MKICSIKNCGRKHKGFGYCRRHYRRFKTYKNPLGHAPEPKGYIAHGYKMISIGRNKRIQEHRLIMEKHIGRKLMPFPKETVHHINGDRLDNRIENLRVISQSEHSIITHRKSIIIGKTRLCLKCKILKTFKHFYTSKNSISGYRTNCKSCEKESNKIRYDKHYKRPYPKNRKSRIKLTTSPQSHN